MQFGEQSNAVCPKCSSTIDKEDMVHWPQGVEEHIDCEAAAQKRLRTHLDGLLDRQPAKHIGSAVNETWNG